MKNIDTILFKVISEEMAKLQPDINKQVTEEKIRSAVIEIIDVEIKRFIIMSIKNRMYFNAKEYFINIIDELFTKKEFLDKIKNNIITQLVEDWR